MMAFSGRAHLTRALVACLKASFVLSRHAINQRILQARWLAPCCCLLNCNPNFFPGLDCTRVASPPCRAAPLNGDVSVMTSRNVLKASIFWGYCEALKANLKKLEGRPPCRRGVGQPLPQHKREASASIAYRRVLMRNNWSSRR